MKRFHLFLLIFATLVTVSAAGTLTPAHADTSRDLVPLPAGSYRTHVVVLNPAMRCPKTFPVTCTAASSGNHATLVSVVQQQFQTISRVDIILHFAGNLVSQGEQVALAAGEGFENTGTSPIATRTVTLDSLYQPDTALFTNTDVAIPIWMEVGSAHLVSASVVITGTLATTS